MSTQTTSPSASGVMFEHFSSYPILEYVATSYCGCVCAPSSWITRILLDGAIYDKAEGVLTDMGVVNHFVFSHQVLS